MSQPLDVLLANVPELPVRYARALAKEKLMTVGEVLAWLPARHEDRRQLGAGMVQASETPVCHHVRVTKASRRFFGRRGAGAFEAQAEPTAGLAGGHTITLRWFGMPFMHRVIAEGLELIVYGRIKEVKNRLVMDHPEFEILKDDQDDEAGTTIHTGRITPVYRLRAGVTQKGLRTAAWFALRHLPNDFTADLLPPPSARGEFAGWTRSRAMRAIHFPMTMEELEAARRYLALEEFFGYQLRVARRRRQVMEAGGHSHRAGELARAFEAALPFQLTPAQQRSLAEIRHDMAAERPMSRLLHGDVGSGKTVVAFAAMLGAVESGRQAALMAPTQILAEQHFHNARKWLDPLGVSVGLRTGSRESDGADLDLWQDQRKQRSRRAGGGPDVVIGTHALLHDAELVHNLGLVVIDEQHKFGVAQRARLIEKGNTPDVLVMTATPIPRTLTLTIYGDLDVSTIDERPTERGQVVTKVRGASKQKEAAAFVRQQLEQGRQAYLVYPLIEESEKLELTAAREGHEVWRKLLEPFQVGLMHGKLPPEEKEAVMRDFRNGRIEAMVSTTVVEVGVDVPNATVMLIHHAERFGLAQLHQLRGRIGRARHSSFCVLFVDDKDAEAKGRLEILEQTNDGFRIAEEDLRRRGPGDVLGRAQSGQAPLRFAELLADSRLVRLARQLAEKTLDEDPLLQAPRLARLRDFVFGEIMPQAHLQ